MKLRIIVLMALAPMLLTGCAGFPLKLQFSGNNQNASGGIQSAVCFGGQADTKFGAAKSCYEYLSQYLSDTKDNLLYGCRSIGRDNYLLCFANENSTQYEIEHTSLQNGKESCIHSGNVPVYTSEGFWVLTTASNGGMEWEGKCYDHLQTYRNTLKQQADVDVSVLGAVDAFAVDMKEKALYAVTHNAQGLNILRMGFRQKNPSVVTTIPQHTNGQVQEITQLHACGNRLMFCGKANSNNQLVSCFGQIQVRQGTVTTQIRQDGGSFAMQPYDGGSFFYDADVATGTLYRLENDKAEMVTVERSQESTRIYSAPSGDQFATSTLLNNGSGQRLEICVYDSNGDKLTTHEYALGNSEPLEHFYFDESTRRVIFESTDTTGKKTWKELIY